MMIQRLLLIGSLLSCGLLVGACGSESEDGIENGEDDITQALLISESGNGKTFTVPKGKDIRVSLESNATTGYKWKVVSTSRTFGYPTPKDGEYITPADRPVGAGGRQVFLWKTTNPLLRPSATAHAVKLEYRRSFENDDTPAEKTFTFKIKIKEGAVLPPPTPTAEPVVLFEEHDGATVRAEVGQNVVVRLAENPSAGYRWYVESTDRTFGYPEKTEAAAENDFTCPPETMTIINCMPIVPANRAKYCAGDYRSWARSNCDVSYLD
jgi:predicted secreted protein